MKIPDATRISPVWLRVGTLIDGVATRPLHDVHVVYDAHQVRFVGQNGMAPPRDVVRDDQKAPDLELPDATLLPGLIEGHAHFFLEGGELEIQARTDALRRSPEELQLSALERLDKLVRLGIAAVRDAGDKDGVGLALSRLYRSDARPLMPYVDSPGAAIHRDGRYGGFMGEPAERHASLAECVAARVWDGADRIKIIATDIIDFEKAEVTAAPQMSHEDIRQIRAAAVAYGRQIFAHASGDAGIEEVIEGRVHSVEHGFFVRDDQLARMRDRQIAWVPTFAPVQAQIDHAARLGWDANVIAGLEAILRQHATSLLKAHAMGVPVVAGSDAGSYGVPHGVGLIAELELMERAGLPPVAVLNAATGVSAAHLAFREPMGRVAPGCRSRFIVTEHAPALSVSGLRHPRVVIFDGAVVSPEAEHDADLLGL